MIEAQRRTEEEIRKLTESLRKLEERVDRIETTLDRLVKDHRETRERLEGLSHTVGYRLEDAAFKGLPKILEEYGIVLEERLVRRYVKLGDKYRQVNIYGHARRDGERILVLGEAKVRPSKKEINRFVRFADSLSRQEGISVFKVFVAYDFPPEIEEYLKERNILPVWSYQLE